MSREIVLTLIIPLFIVCLWFISLVAIVKLKHWRKRRMIERGITDLVSRVRS